jgi:hypothetical protein
VRATAAFIFQCTKNTTPIYECAGSINETDIKRIVEQLLSTKVSVVGYGALAELPEYDRIDAAVAQNNVKLLDRNKLFSFGRG